VYTCVHYNKTAFLLWYYFDTILVYNAFIILNNMCSVGCHKDYW